MRVNLERNFSFWQGSQDTRAPREGVPMRDTRAAPPANDFDRIDLTNARLYRDGFPHALFARLRREAPVWWHAAPAGFAGVDPGFWVLSRYDDVQAANRDAELFSALDGPSLAHRPEMHGTMLVSMDGHPHARLRRLISAGFTPRMVGRLEQQMRRWAATIIDDALARGTCDFVHDIAYQLPMHVIADIVGIPVEDRRRLFQLANAFVSAGDVETERSRGEQMAIQAEMFQYARTLGQDKRARPQDDVWTILSTVEVDTDDGGRTALSEIELDLFFLLLTVAGSETTRNAIAAGLIALVAHPDQLDALRRDPAALEPAVEEILRWSSPVCYFARRATRDTEIRGVGIAAGQRITLWYPSANRDEDVFDDPFRFDIARTPNKHLTFAAGIHFCLGAPLARLEAQIAVATLLRRFTDIRLEAQEPEWLDSMILRGVKSLKVTFAAA
jgi:cytochrome P450